MLTSPMRGVVELNQAASEARQKNQKNSMVESPPFKIHSDFEPAGDVQQSPVYLAPAPKAA